MARAPSSSSRSSPSSRRAPRQRRARATVDYILEAARELIARDGAAALNTNAIAARAGVSVGTLYEYFPNKEAILVALARDLLDRDQALMLEAILPRSDEDVDATAARVVRTLIALHREEHRVRRTAMGEHLAQGFAGEHAALFSLGAARLSALDDKLARPLTPTGVFVLSRAVLGAIHAALGEDPALLSSSEFEVELIALAAAFLRARGA